MLYQLAKYAEKKGLKGRPGYEYKTAKAIVVLDTNGYFIHVEPGEREFFSCPSLSQGELISGGTTRSHFLLDSMGTVTGVEDKYLEKHSAFVELHNAASKKVPSLIPLANLLTDVNQCKLLSDALAAAKVKVTDNITFRITGAGDCVPEWTEWHGFWDAYRKSLSSPELGQQMRCLLNGELTVPVKVIGQKLKLNSVGGQSTGSALIGFDKDAFTSYGLEQSENAACSDAAAALFSGALNDLIRNAPHPLANILLLHWLDELVPPEDDPFGWFEAKTEDSVEEIAAIRAVKQLTKTIHSGERPEILHNRYHIIMISGSAGRAMVRGVQEGSLDDLYCSVEKWFNDLAITKEHGRTEADPPALFAVLVRMLPYLPDLPVKKLADMMNDRLSPLMVRLWGSILQGMPLPREAAQFALRFAKSKLIRGEVAELSSAKTKQDRSSAVKTKGAASGGGAPNLDRISCSLIKAWYNRAVEKGWIKGGKALESTLNKEYPSSAYQAGRLLAVLNHLQHKALGDVGADVVQRFYSAASVTPGLVIGRLISGAQPHLAKLRKDDSSKGLCVWYEKQIQEIMSMLNDDALKQLDFTGQTLFAMGYYHQVANLFDGNADTKDTTKE